MEYITREFKEYSFQKKRKKHIQMIFKVMFEKYMKGPKVDKRKKGRKRVWGERERENKKGQMIRRLKEYAL